MDISAKWPSVLWVLALSVAAGTFGCPTTPETGGENPYSTFSAESMATTVVVVLPAGASAEADAGAVFDIFRKVDARMSEWKPTSPLSEVNRRAGEAVPVPEDLRAVVRRGVEIGNLTGGAFDITWAALWGLWDFKAPKPVPPVAEKIAERVARIDYKKVEIDDGAGTVKLGEPKMLLGLGGIAKGYALDLAAAELRRRGQHSFSITAGGQVMAGGLKGDRPWRVGIRDPRGSREDFFAIVEATDLSVSTSGDYERFFIHDGVRYHHILDPRSGQPARGLRSVTVLSGDATLADALSTAMLVMGAKEGLALAERTEGVEAVVVDAAAEVHMTEGARSRVRITHPPRPNAAEASP